MAERGKKKTKKKNEEQEKREAARSKESPFAQLEAVQ